MSESDFEYLPLRLAYPFLAGRGLGADAEAVRVSKERLGGYTTTLKRARLAHLMLEKNILDDFIAKHWRHGGTSEGKQMLRNLENIYSRYKEGGAKIDLGESDNEEPEGRGFAYEEHLRDFLVRNLGRLEPGLTLWPTDPDVDAVEFQIAGRRIDILGRDSQGVPVVIELKVSRGHEKTIGQCLYYRAKVRERLGRERVRIFIVALNIDEELTLATRELQDVSLFEYTLSMNVTKL
jgi:hypothetical protein